MPKNFSKVIVFVIVTGLAFLSSSSVMAFSYLEWTEVTPTGTAENKDWSSVAIDATGDKMFAAVSGGRAYISNDGGTSWSETMPTGVAENKYWDPIVMSSDGTHLMAAIYGGRIYVSSNGGTSWGESRPTGIDQNVNWGVIAVDADGSKMAAGVYPGRIYLSSNGGTSWTETFPTGLAENKNWFSVAMDSDGSHLIAGVAAGRVYISNNGGTSWTETFPSGAALNKNWRVSINSDGSKLFASGATGRIYISDNWGGTWQEVYPTGIAEDKNWSQLSMDSDGSHLIAPTSARIYLSGDSGSTWNETFPTGLAENKNWRIKVNSDGTKLISSVWGGRIYVGSNVPPLSTSEPTPTPTPTPIPEFIEFPPDPNIIPGWAEKIMAGPGYTGIPNYISNNHPAAEKLVNVFVDRETHHDDLYIEFEDFGWINILAFWNNPDEVKLPWTQGLNTVSEIQKIEAKASFNGYPVNETDNPYIIILGYDKNKLGKLDQKQLKIAHFNEQTKKWQTINNPYVYPDGKVATTTNKFGYFSVVYPRSVWGQ